MLTALLAGASHSSGGVARNSSVGKAIVYIAVGAILSLIVGAHALRGWLRARRVDRNLSEGVAGFTGAAVAIAAAGAMAADTAA
jgi:hypothetical protein